MDGIGDIFTGIIEFIIRLLYGVVRLIIYLIGFILSGTWLANHFEGLRRFGWWLACAMIAYLVFGILRATVDGFATPGLTPIYQWQLVLGAVVMLLVGIALRELDEANYGLNARPPIAKPNHPDSQTGPIQTQSTVHSAGIVAALVLVALMVGLVSAYSSERHEATLAENLCAQADARISEGVEQTVRDGAGLFDRVFGTQTANRIPCDD